MLCPIYATSACQLSLSSSSCCVNQRLTKKKKNLKWSDKKQSSSGGQVFKVLQIKYEAEDIFISTKEINTREKKKFQLECVGCTGLDVLISLSVTVTITIQSLSQSPSSCHSDERTCQCVCVCLNWASLTADCWSVLIMERVWSYTQVCVGVRVKDPFSNKWQNRAWLFTHCCVSLNCVCVMKITVNKYLFPAFIYFYHYCFLAQFLFFWPWRVFVLHCVTTEELCCDAIIILCNIL